MSSPTWDFPRTEQGLQALLAQLAQCRAAGEDREVGYGLLALGHMVKWVRSDNAEPPFVRARTLAGEALEIFRRLGDAKGQVRALIAASAMTDPETCKRLLDEAERLATGSDVEEAHVISAQARQLALSDRPRALELDRKALEIYRRTNNALGQARCLFAIAICDDVAETKRDAALEAAAIYREAGELSEASRCVSLALMSARELQPVAELETLARQGLEDALSAGNRSLEKLFYGELAKIAIAKGDAEAAHRYRKWEEAIERSDGLTPMERWKEKVEMSKTLVAMAKTSGSKEMVKTFKEELRRVKAERPRRK